MASNVCRHHTLRRIRNIACNPCQTVSVLFFLWLVEQGFDRAWELEDFVPFRHFGFEHFRIHVECTSSTTWTRCSLLPRPLVAPANRQAMLSGLPLQHAYEKECLLPALKPKILRRSAHRTATRCGPTEQFQREPTPHHGHAADGCKYAETRQDLALALL